MPKHIKEVLFGEHVLRLETGEIARQANGAVLASMNGTQILVTVVAKKDSASANDFFPLTVNYQEKSYAAGKIPGGYPKREGAPKEKETLIARLIDRALRPLFPKGFRCETQIIATVLSFNPQVPVEIVAMIGASAAVAVSDIPFTESVGAVRIGYNEGIYSLNLSDAALEKSALNLVVAGTKDAILMVESEAKELSEDIMLGAVLFGQEMMKGVIGTIDELAALVNKPKWAWQAPEKNHELMATVEQLAASSINDAYLVKDKQARYQQLAEVKKQCLTQIIQENLIPNLDESSFNEAFEQLEKNIVRNRILTGESRIDGRNLTTVRPITIRPKILERTHGSVLFTRGETQAIVVATLGNERDAQIIDGISGETKDKFLLHYNFPPFSVGETGMIGSPKRREIGHGRLAKRSLMAVLPSYKEFPYVIRVVSEITESNGSSSMASVCGTSLALMDAGVPLKAPVAGVAMGLIKEQDKFAVLTDILGDEDHLGDMDFKVAGTVQGITALQMDIKITGITKDIMQQALNQALAGRLHILEVMNNALAEPRSELSEHAPRIASIKVPEDKIRTIIGKGGATIKSLTETTGVSIDIDDSGLVQLFSPDLQALEEAERQIKLLIAEVEVGKTYKGKVNKIVDFGAFINLLPGKDGLLHISQICANRNQKVETVLAEGQDIEVFVAGMDKQGRVKLEWKDKPTTVVDTEMASDNEASSELTKKKEQAEKNSELSTDEQE